jgi:hypothetical protein
MGTDNRAVAKAKKKMERWKEEREREWLRKAKKRDEQVGGGKTSSTSGGGSRPAAAAPATKKGKKGPAVGAKGQKSMLAFFTKPLR